MFMNEIREFFMHKWLHFSILCMALAPFISSTAGHLPKGRPEPVLGTIEPPATLEIKTPAGLFRPGEMIRSQSLDGFWKFSGLTASALPFAAPSDRERQCLMPEFDDSGWQTIRVPLNWFRDPRYSYEKMYQRGTKIDPAYSGGSDSHSAKTPYFKGNYRHEFELPDPLPPERYELEFDGIGYEAEIYVNGRHAGRHHGDFVFSRLEVTGLVKPGKNLVALRVLANFRPHDKTFTRIYGAMWSATSIKGGIWLPVRIVARPEPVVKQMLLTPDHTGNLRVDYVIDNCGGKPLTLIPGLNITNARDRSEQSAWEFAPVILKPGRNQGSVALRMDPAKPWSPDAPHLYDATFYWRDGKKVHSAAVERFGFREFKTAGTRFLLNGKPVYLYCETAQPVRFGGYDTEDSNDISAKDLIAAYRKLGYNMLRTAHMPVRQEFLDAADELGMMIYNEWGFSFIPRIAEREFEKNNLPELERFLIADHNHPSVVMWSLGNEVPHRNSPAITRQLAKQVALARRTDLQKRPICAFAGNGDVNSWGRGFIDTDVIDFHIYTGVNGAWTRWNPVFNLLYRWSAEIYGKDGVNIKPIIISECMGGGWGMRPDPAFRPGDIEQYLKKIKQPFTWGNPGAAGYSGVIGVAAALDPELGPRWLQARIGRRVAELIRQDSRIAGFAPWQGDSGMKWAVLWNQPVYPGLRYPAGIMPRQFRTPAVFRLEAFLLNQNGPELKHPQLQVELAAAGRIIQLSTVRFPPLAAGESRYLPVMLDLPELEQERAELRLRVIDEGREIAYNFYEVTLHADRFSFAPARNPRPVALLNRNPEVEGLLKKLNIPFVPVSDMRELAKFRRALLPLSSPWSGREKFDLRRYVGDGGFLLILEPGDSRLPGFPEYQVVTAGHTLIEPIIPAHPIFAGLKPGDFDTWAENIDGDVVRSILTPLNTGALAARGTTLQKSTIGAAAAETVEKKGRLMVSTFQALEVFRQNGAAARYLGNLLRYFSSETNLYPARPLERTANDHTNYPPPGNPKFIDLTAFANRSFSGESLAGGASGWLGQGDNDFRRMPAGRQSAAGIPFEFPDSAVRSCLILQGKERPDFPSAIRGIPVKAKVASLYFLHAAAWAPSDSECGSYMIRYSDGKVAEYLLVCGKNINDWWKPDTLPEAVPAFVHTNAIGGKVGLFISRWNNPRPDVPVDTIDFVAEKSGAGPVPILAAITAEPAEADFAPVYLPGNAAPRWHFTSTPAEAAGTGRTVRTPNPAGVGSSLVTLPGNVGDKVSVAVLPYDPAILQKGPFRTLSFLIRSRTGGILDIVIPQKDWKSERRASLELAADGHHWLRVRLDWKRDFLLTRQEFNAKAMRPELLFCNGRDRAAGFPRNRIEFEITDIRFE